MFELQVRLRDEQKGEDDRQTRSDNLSPIQLHKAEESIKQYKGDLKKKQERVKNAKFVEEMKGKFKFDNVYADSVVPLPPLGFLTNSPKISLILKVLELKYSYSNQFCCASSYYCAFSNCSLLYQDSTCFFNVSERL